MQKKIMCFVIALMMTGLVFAEKTKVHGIGISVPLEWQFWHADDILKNQTFSNVGVNLNYKAMSIHGERLAGFSAIYEIQLGYFYGKSSKNNLSYNSFDFFNMKWGWGIAFRPNSKIILSTHVTLGYDMKLLWNQDDSPLPPDFTLRVGQDFVFVYKFTERFGISAGIDAYVPVIGMGFERTREEDSSRSKGYKEKMNNYTIYGGFGCDLKIGVCWVY